MDPRRDLPAGWRQPPETTAEPVSPRRPYLGRFLPRPDQAPQPRFTPRPPVTGQGRVPGRMPGGQAPPPGKEGPDQPRAASGRGQRRRPAPTVPQRPRRLPAMRRWRPMRSVLGDEIGQPILWCEFGSCIARFTAPGAPGEGELRGRALASGWRYDAIGRLACPSCVRHDPAFWTGRPPGGHAPPS